MHAKHGAAQQVVAADKRIKNNSDDSFVVEKNMTDNGGHNDFKRIVDEMVQKKIVNRLWAFCHFFSEFVLGESGRGQVSCVVQRQL